MEVVRIGQYHLCARGFELVRGQGFDIGERTNGHEAWRFNDTVGCLETTGAGLGVGAAMVAAVLKGVEESGLFVRRAGRVGTWHDRKL